MFAAFASSEIESGSPPAGAEWGEARRRLAPAMLPFITEDALDSAWLTTVALKAAAARLAHSESTATERLVRSRGNLSANAKTPYLLAFWHGDAHTKGESVHRVWEPGQSL